MDTEDLDWKPDKVKLESELILDDETDNFTGSHQEACHEGPNTTYTEQSYNAAPPESTSHDEWNMMLKIKEEKTEDEDPLADPLMDDGQHNLPKIVLSAFLGDGSMFLQEEISIKKEDDFVEGNYIHEKKYQHDFVEAQEMSTKELSIDVGRYFSTEPTATTSLVAEADALMSMCLNATEMIICSESELNQSFNILTSCVSLEKEIKIEGNGAEIDPLSNVEQCSPTNEKIFSCDQCPTSFETSHELKKHAVIHADKRTFACNQCSARFLTSFELMKHLPAHTDLRAFSCDRCTARFLSSEELNKHSRIHSDKRPFACNQCSARFKKKSTLRNHQLSHSIVRPFFCKLCSARFKYKRSLRSHLIVHSEERPFPCEQCSARFKRNRDLRKHLESHSNERAFPCNHCSASFKTRGSLNSHIRLQSDKRPFWCGPCSARFKTKWALKMHLKTHSNNAAFIATSALLGSTLAKNSISI